MLTLCLATNNPGKVAEIKALLPHINWISLQEAGITEELPEPHRSLHENSANKAMYVWERYQLSCLADDTGLEVEALDGAPGVDTAFYAGSEKNPLANMNKLLHELKGNPNRNAKFRTVVSLVLNGILHQFEGSVAGHIAMSMSGVEGFGYDPIFIPDGHILTFAELDKKVKNSLSHRGNALRATQVFLQDSGNNPI